MSEEDLFTTDATDLEGMTANGEGTGSGLVDFEQNGLLLKIASDGIAVQDYVKRLKESDILVAVDGELFLDGPAKLEDKFIDLAYNGHKIEGLEKKDVKQYINKPFFGNNVCAFMIGGYFSHDFIA